MHVYVVPGSIVEAIKGSFMRKSALVLGAGGFIGSHLVRVLKTEGFWVRGVDLKLPEFSQTEADDFLIGDLRDASVCNIAIDRKFDEIYQLAADYGRSWIYFYRRKRCGHYA